jgi:hypothetical protein
MSYNDDSYGRREGRDDGESYGRSEERREGGQHGRREEEGDSYGRDDERRGGGRGGREEEGSYGGGEGRGEGGHHGRREDEGRQEEGGRRPEGREDRYEEGGRRPEGREDRYGGGGGGGGGGGREDTYGKESAGSSYGSGPTGTSYGGGGGSSDDYSGAAQAAQSHAGSSGDGDMFNNILGGLMGKKQQLQNEDVDEQDAVQQHQTLYGGGGPSGPVSEKNMGVSSPLYSLFKKIQTWVTDHKMLGCCRHASTQNVRRQSRRSVCWGCWISKPIHRNGDGSGRQTFRPTKCCWQHGMFCLVYPQLKIFQLTAQQSSGASKESAVAQAGQMALKMYMKSEMGGGGAGGSAGGLLSMASKFL